MKTEVRLINIGRDNRNKTFFSTSESGLGDEILETAKQFLHSDNVWLVESKESTDKVGVYLINAGFHTVGRVELREVKQ